MTKQEIITKFELYLDDMTELSSQEQSDLFDKIYNRVNTDRPWEGTKKEYSGTASGVTLSLPSDFLYLTENNNYTDSSELAGRPVIFVGSDYSPYQVVSWSDRRQYRNRSNVAWIDWANSNLVFASDPGSKAVEYDYHGQKAALADDESPWFPVEFHDVIYHGMCVDDFIIQQSEKARSYQDEHEKQYKEYIRNMALWNSRLIQM